MLELISQKLVLLATTLQVLGLALAAPATYEVLPPNANLAVLGGLNSIVATSTTNDEIVPVIADKAQIQPFYLPDRPTQGQIRTMVAHYAKEYGVSQVLALTIAELESKFNPLAINPKSGAGGIFQWLKSSWVSFCEGDRFDIEDNTLCAVRTLSEPNGIRHWSADLSMRRQLINEGLIECFEGKNNCVLK